MKDGDEEWLKSSHRLVWKPTIHIKKSGQKTGTFLQKDTRLLVIYEEGLHQAGKLVTTKVPFPTQPTGNQRKAGGVKCWWQGRAERWEPYTLPGVAVVMGSLKSMPSVLGHASLILEFPPTAP